MLSEFFVVWTRFVELLIVYSLVDLGHSLLSTPHIPDTITGKQDKVDFFPWDFNEFWLRAYQLLTSIKFFPSLELEVTQGSRNSQSSVDTTILNRPFSRFNAGLLQLVVWLMVVR